MRQWRVSSASENRARPPPRIPRSRYRAARPVRLYRRLLQSAAHPLRHRLHHPTAGRGEIRVTRCPLFRGKVTRSRARIVGSLGQPILFLLALGYGFGPTFARAGAGDYLQFLAPGIITMGILFTAVFGGIEIIWDRQFGF